MKIRRFAALLALAACSPAAAFAAAAVPPAAPGPVAAAPVPNLAAVRQQLVQLAQGLQYFETGNLISNRGPFGVGPLRLMLGGGGTAQYWLEPLAREHQQMLTTLRSLGAEHTALAALLQDADPKVRTLALGGLFIREDAHDLPLIAPLVRDSDPTWPVFGGQVEGGESNLPPIPQLVGDVAKAMLLSYLEAAHANFFISDHDPRTLARIKPADVLEAFSRYWAVRESRAYCASWFLVKMERATRKILPFSPENQVDIDRVLAEINAVPPVERGWTLLYVNEGMFHDRSDQLVPDAKLVAALKGVGPEALTKFLQRQLPTDDPDVRLGPSGSMQGQFTRSMEDFILAHESELRSPLGAGQAN